MSHRSEPGNLPHAIVGSVARLLRPVALAALSVCAVIAAAPEHARAQEDTWTAINLGSLGTGLNAHSAAFGVNSRGDVVGFTTFDDPDAAVHAFLWTSTGGMRDLGTLGGHSSVASGINDARQVVGNSVIAGSREITHAFLWSAGTGMLDLGTLGRSSGGTAINNHAQIIGWSFTAAGNEHPFLWTAATGMVDIDPACGLGCTSIATGINDSGQVVGMRFFESGYRQGYLWTPGAGMQFLGDWALGVAGITDAGQVIGTTVQDGQYRPFVWSATGGLSVMPIVGIGHGLTDDDRAFVSIEEVFGTPESGQIRAAAPWVATGPTFDAPRPLPPVSPWLLPRFNNQLEAVSNAGAVGWGNSPVTSASTVAVFWCRAGAPTVTDATASPAILSPPSGELVTIRVDYNVTTPCGSTSTSMLSVTADEPLSPSDIVIVDDHAVRLRASRDEAGDGRVYTIEIRAQDTAGRQTTAQVTVTVPRTTVGGPLTAVTLSSTLASPQPAGTTIAFTATGVGGTAPLAYRFWVQPWSTGVWQVLQDWSTSSTLEWTPAVAGGYNVSVEARGAGATAVEVQTAIGYTIGDAGDDGGGGGGGGATAMTSVALTTSVPQPQRPGTTVTLAATGTGGTAPHAYRFWVQPWNGEWTVVREWSTTPTAVWTPTEPGGYNIAVEARSAGAASKEVESAANFVIATP